MFKKIVAVTICLFIVILNSGVTLAQSDKGDGIFFFYLFYDHGKLFKDRDFPQEYQVFNGDFEPEVITTSKPFRAEIVSIGGGVITDFLFDPQQGDPTFTKGKIDVQAPYLDGVAIVKFYDPENKLVFSVDVEDTQFCNEDLFCELDSGENAQNCPSDCKAIPTPVVSIVPSITPIPSESSSDWLMIVVILVILAVVGLAIWFIIRNRRDKVGDISADLP